MGKEELKRDYLNQAASLRTKVEKEKKVLFIIAALRLIVFIGGIILIYMSFDLSKYLGFSVLVFFVSLFLFLLRCDALHSSHKVYLENLELINLNEAKALDGDFSMFNDGSTFIRNDHDFTYDADIFGPSSLFQYLCRTCTGYGSQVLAGWLSDPYTVSISLAKRQETIKEMSGKDQWRKSFLATGMNRTLDESQISGLTAWLSKEDLINTSAYRKVIMWLLPVFNLLSLGIVIAGVISYSVFIGFFLLSLFTVIINLKKTSAIHTELTGRFRFIDSLGKLLGLIDSESFDSSLINIMKTGIIGRERTAVKAAGELGRIINSFDSRLNVIVGFVLNGLLLWDLHCVRRLEKWKMIYREQFPLWLKMIGQTDAFISLGNYTFNNREFAFPDISTDGTAVFNAVQLGHPLIHVKGRVCNDFILDEKGKICVITGANMAGKSTFLRSVAVNYVLAMTGAPVCAEKLVFTPLKLFTSMRTTDSLSSNESYFYAELKRLRILKQKLQEGENLFFLLDEILKGTNSEDKSQGSKIFIDKLINLGGTGMIATHDLSLGELEEIYPGIIMNKCIEVDIDGEKINFDYILRDGIAKNRNAVLLMRQMGILD